MSDTPETEAHKPPTLASALPVLKYWADLAECVCDSPYPQGGCLACDLEECVEAVAEELGKEED